jgi:hypothetical protein
MWQVERSKNKRKETGKKSDACLLLLLLWRMAIADDTALLLEARREMRYAMRYELLR